MKFIEVRAANGSLTLFNLDHIAALQPSQTDEGKCCLYTSDGDCWWINENYAVVVGKIQIANRGEAAP
jgi:hypothetical protein